MANKSKNARSEELDALLMQLLDAFHEHVSVLKLAEANIRSKEYPPTEEELDAAVNPAFPSALKASRLAFGPSVERSARALLEWLGPDAPFEGWSELVHVVADFFVEAKENRDANLVGDGRLTPLARAELGARVRNPIRSFRFYVEWTLGSGHAFHGKDGGPHAVEWVNWDDEGLPGVAMKGIVSACTTRGAVQSVERLLDAAHGAALALGLTGAIVGPVIETRPIAAELGSVTVPLDPGCAYRICSSFMKAPDDLSDLERRKVAEHGLGAAIERHHGVLAKVVAGTGERAEEVRNACRLANVAAHSRDFGLLIALAFTVMEGLLLDPANSDAVVAKVSEAIAHSIGRSSAERTEIRARVKKLYGIRSTFTHTGLVKAKEAVAEEVRDMMLAVLRKEMNLLPDLE